MEKCVRCGRELEFSPIVHGFECTSCNPGAFPRGNEEFVRENLKNIILTLVEQHPTSGYDIMKVISQKFNVQVSHGRVYPLLYSLVDEGILKQLGEKKEVKSEYATIRYKFYSLTEEGINLLRERAAELEGVKKSLGLK